MVLSRVVQGISPSGSSSLYAYPLSSWQSRCSTIACVLRRTCCTEEYQVEAGTYCIWRRLPSEVEVGHWWQMSSGWLTRLMSIDLHTRPTQNHRFVRLRSTLYSLLHSHIPDPRPH